MRKIDQISSSLVKCEMEMLGGEVGIREVVGHSPPLGWFWDIPSQKAIGERLTGEGSYGNAMAKKELPSLVPRKWFRRLEIRTVASC